MKNSLGPFHLSQIAIISLLFLSTTANSQSAIPNPVCYGDPINLICNFPACGSPGATYAWTNTSGSWTSNEPNPVILPNTPGYASDKFYLQLMYSPPPGSFASGRVTVTVLPPFNPGSVSTGQAICAGTPPSPLTATLPTGGSPAYAYQWQSSADNVMFTNIPGASALTYSPGILTTTTHYRQVQRDQRSCLAITDTVSITMAPLPDLPGAISGPTNVSPGQTNVIYSVPAISGATGYNWLLPGGADITAGSNTNVITVIFAPGAPSGIIAVSGTNDCGEGPVSEGLLVNVGTSVPPVLSLFNLTIGNGVGNCYNATHILLIAGGGYYFNVLNGAMATMISGQLINLFPGTSVASGGYLHGYITPSGNYCQNPNTSMVAVTPNFKKTSSIGLPESGIKLYPNPTSGTFMLELPDDACQYRVDIFGMWGEKVLTSNLQGEIKQEFSLSDKPAGIYFIRLLCGGKAESLKIIKE